MKITESIVNHVATLQLEGNFTYNQRRAFQEAVKKAWQQNAQHIMIDLSQVAFVDSAALGLLMVTHRQLSADKRKLSLVHPQPTVKQIIELANLHQIIPIAQAGDMQTMRKTA